MASRFRLHPHRLASDSALEWGPWWARDEAGERELGRMLEKWDYAASVTVGCQCLVDVERVCQDTGLPETARVLLVLHVDCPPTGARFLGAEELSLQRQQVLIGLSVDLPPGQYSGHLKLNRSLVLADNCDGPSGAAASRLGSRLWEGPSRRLDLEGDGGRFPVEPIKFTATNVEGAAWRLDLTFDTLDDSFLGAVRLLVNTEHPAGRTALNDISREGDLIRSVMRADIIRQLFQSISRDGREQLEPAIAREDSLAAVADHISELYLGRDIKAGLELMRSDPVHFDAILQDRSQFLTQVDV